mmetsp:Transcript_25859/g.53920  ORF Transcript_25859/g.53920 Transcript_25859/m.53920 type:complete len:86 (-) Transcript_25859:386-643(-)
MTRPIMASGLSTITRGGGKMTSFHMYGNNLRTQAEILEKLITLDFTVIAPGHGHPQTYSTNDTLLDQKQKDLQVALDDMMVSRRW